MDWRLHGPVERCTKFVGGQKLWVIFCKAHIQGKSFEIVNIYGIRQLIYRSPICNHFITCQSLSNFLLPLMIQQVEIILSGLKFVDLVLCGLDLLMACLCAKLYVEGESSLIGKCCPCRYAISWLGGWSTFESVGRILKRKGQEIPILRTHCYRMKCHDRKIIRNISGIAILSRISDESIFCNQHHANDIL